MTKNGTWTVNRRMMLLGMTALCLASALPQAAFASKAEDAASVITNFNRPKSVASTVTEVLKEGDYAVPMLAPSSAADMLAAISRYEIIASRGGWQEVSTKREMMRGQKSEEVEALRKRLFLEGYLPEAESTGQKYSKEVEAAVLHFQRNHGLQQTGRVDGPTLAELNVSAEGRLTQLRANLPRVELYSQGLAGQRYVIVNVPATQLEIVNADGKVFSRHNIIAGRPERPSPVVSTQIDEIKFNPYWNAPVSIVERDIIPLMLKDKDTLKKMNIKVFDGYDGPEVDPATVDWSKTPANRYFFRQEPGGENAMASVKIQFQSPFGVYMHDTPTKQFFGEAERYLSSGCVRVDQVHVLVNWILNGQDGWNMDRIEDVSAKVERMDVGVISQPQLRWVYLTGWATPDGQVNFRPDVYELDGSGFVSGQPTPVGEVAEDGRRWLDKMPPAAVLGSQAVQPDEDPGTLSPAPEKTTQLNGTSSTQQ